EQPAPVPRICGECGAPYTPTTAGRATCTACTGEGDRARPTRGSTAQRGYGARWQRLSQRARRLQPFCLDCGTTQDLTTDHTPQAWKRQQEGKSIRLADVVVVCRPCNSERGAARGERSAR